MRFEYREIRVFRADLIKEMNKLGQEGWELVSTLYYPGAQLFDCIIKKKIE